MSGNRLRWESSRDVYLARIRDAKTDREEAKSLLDDFAELAEDGTNAHPVLVAYVANCIKNWISNDLSAESATRAFNVVRPRHRPLNDRTGLKHAEVWRCFLMLRARGHRYEAACVAAATRYRMSLQSVKNILRATDAEVPFWAAILSVRRPRVRERLIRARPGTAK